MYKHLIPLGVTFALASTLSAAELYEKSLEELFSMETEVKADVGSRSGSRDFLNSNVPIKVITNKQIQNSGLKRLTKVLSYFIAGFNAPSPAIRDGSDHISVGTLRGLNPDQVLVLVNGKRLHSSSLIHVNDTVGRGSTGVDLNTIPVAAIEHIEILSDGAAAQYGSDAIAGVINVILKGVGHKSVVSSRIGTNLDGGGNSYQTDLFHTIPLDYDGFINLTSSLEVKNRTNHERAGNSTPFGQPDATDFSVGINTLAHQSNDIDIYTNGFFNYRDSTNNANFRSASADNTSIYSNGFLPEINLQMTDLSFAVGARGIFAGDITWDLSQKIGYNKIDYGVNNSMNYSIGASSPTSFDAGGLESLQATTNFDLKASYDSFNIAGGVELRYESFAINAGDSASFDDGNGTKAAGSQGFPGFGQNNAVNENRNNIALYIQVDKQIDDFSIELATRLENYSDFGSTNDYKISLSYKASDALLLRASGSTGFRAPSLSQSYFSASGTTNINGVLSKTDTLRTSDPVAIGLGAKELTAEKSIHFTSGFVYQANDDLSFSADYFYTKIDDRIMLSGDINYDSDNNGTNDSVGRFFTNAVNTETQGVDVSLAYTSELENNAKLSLNASYAFSSTKILSFNDTTTGLSDSLTEITRIENAQPKDYIKLFANYELNPVNIALNITRVGKFNDVFNSQVQTFAPQWTTDLDISYLFSKKMKVAVGGTNIFNSYPDKWNASNAVSYSRYSPLGFNGGFYYVRASYEF